MIKFFFISNLSAQSRMTQYFETLSQEQKYQLEGEVIRKCISRGKKEVDN